MKCKNENEKGFIWIGCSMTLLYCVMNHYFISFLAILSTTAIGFLMGVFTYKNLSEDKKQWDGIKTEKKNQKQKK